jgi:hypothetical protein
VCGKSISKEDFMPKEFDPTPAYVHPLDTAMYKVSDPGWYLFDDNHHPVGGPFASRDDAMDALKPKTKKSTTKKKSKKK